MLNSQILELLGDGLLSSEEARSAAYLAEKMKVCEKTVRVRMKELNQYLCKNGAHIVSRARYGYKICVEDEDKFQQFLEENTQSENKIPENSYERTLFLMAYLMNHKDFVKLDDLSEFMYVSKQTLSRSLKNVELILLHYDIEIERRPNYGIRIRGEEFDIRRLLCDYFIKKNSLNNLGWNRQQEEIRQLADVTVRLLAKYELNLSEISLENFVEYVYVACKRMSHGEYLELRRDDIPEIGMREQQFMKELMSILGQANKIQYSPDEERYILLYLAGKRIIGNALENDTNFIINEEIDRLAVAMINVAVSEYHMNFQNNLELRMALNQHLVPFDIRMKYKIPLENPLLEDVKKEYSLAYEMASQACRILEEHYGRTVEEDEIGYFALIFELAIETRQTQKGIDILIVCSSGKGSSRLLKYKYEQEFAAYINKIYLCDLIGLKEFDFSAVDYVFTTVPISMEVPVPIVEVGLFLGTSDINKVTEVLKRGKDGFLKQYYTEQRFICDFEAESIDEALKKLCDLIRQNETVDEDFYEQVLKREAYTQMDYGNGIAIPHPNRLACEESFAYVAVLNDPIIWNKREVQVILLTSIGRKTDKNRQKFYEATARFALDQAAICQLIQKPKYEVLLQLLQQ